MEKEQEKKEMVIEQLNFFWNTLSSYISEEDYQYSNPKEATEHLISLFSIINSSLENLENKDGSEKVYRVLLSISLVMGKMEKDQVTKFLEKNEKELLQILMSCFRSKEEKVTNVSIELIQRIFPKNDKSDQFGLVESMFSLIETEDSVSSAVIGFLAMHSAQNPDTLIKNLFSRIDSKKTIERKNSIRIISKLFEIIENQENKIEKMQNLT